MRLSQIFSVLTLTLLLTALPAAAAPIYSNDFQGSVGPEWSNTSVYTMGSGNKFLGQFANQTVSLTLTGVAPSFLQVDFDLYIIGGWDGNSSTYGPDTWTLVADGSTLLNTTFSNRSSNQAYPDSYPGGAYSKYTGAVEYPGTAGYYSPGIPTPTGDSDYALYHLTSSFLFAGGTLVINISSNVNSPGGETFGIDNVTVTDPPSYSAPEPAASFLLGLGLIGLAVFRKKFTKGTPDRLVEQ